ncbi:MAG: hypothetical protein U1D41_10620 [Nitrosomonas sp.]|uniref:hypothetical protein n=1 Tax=Nitrosomonas sp. TaxID=42353 RepID=UPI00273651F3|nr:hypothetical protein [Nitrosomonas sp.]MDP3664265.1 hypothetical protein [Nitrosomonas sp.]MDZ4106593.1 hypothetical protein [Nitrosomonas sp.]
MTFATSPAFRGPDWVIPTIWASRVGASEYILSPDSPYQIKRVVETVEYCR